MRRAPRRAAVVAGAMALWLVGPAPARAERFPVGLYGVESAGDLAAVRAWGIDTVIPLQADPAGLDALARRARGLGMSLVVPPGSLVDQPVSLTRDWPVEAWYLVDEPEARRIPPAEVEALSARVRRWDPGRRQLVCLGEGSAAAAYGRFGDALMLDWYPVPHLPLESVGEQIGRALESLPEGKPLWAVIQAFDWREFPQKDPRRPRVGRFPDHAEIRFMTYLALARGARGIFYYTFSRPSGGNLLETPERWQAVARVAAELGALRRVLERGRGVALPVPPAGGLEMRAWRWRLRDYVLVVNPGAAPAEIPPDFLRPSWRPLFEVRRHTRDLLQRDGPRAMMAPRQALVLESRLRLWPF